MGLAEWRSAGKPYHLAEPISSLVGRLRAYGYTVGTIGNDAHLTARVPEDHTPFSATGWPAPNPYPWVHACDIMAPAPSLHLPDLVALGRQIVADRLANDPGVSWLKYINWTTAAGNCVHEVWAPGHTVKPSNDRGHIHLSARTDHTHTPAAYDPVDRIRGHKTPAPPAVTKAPPFRRVLEFVPGHTPLHGDDVKQWQGRMHQRGWRVTLDGVYGAMSAGTCRNFQKQKRLLMDAKVGPVTWSATWGPQP